METRQDLSNNVHTFFNSLSHDIALQFYSSGTRLDDPDGLLEGTGKKMRHVKIRSLADIRRTLFASWLDQASPES